MSLKRHSGIVGLALLLSQALYPCSIVIIGGYTPTAVRQLSGTVIGSGRFDLMGTSHDEERRSITVTGATISIKTRTDTAFYKKGEIEYPPGAKPSEGNLKEWQCGIEVSSAKTNQAGNFTISPLKPGKYCLDITGLQPKDRTELLMHDSFIVDVVASAPKADLIANISPR
ncbi:MAG: hypothetical protein WCE52_08055 [Candidatus Acidiferrum sp.]